MRFLGNARKNRVFWTTITNFAELTQEIAGRALFGKCIQLLWIVAIVGFDAASMGGDTSTSETVVTVVDDEDGAVVSSAAS